MKAPIAAPASSRVSKWCRWMHSSLRVRMKRSATPLHSGSPTSAGVERMLSHVISAWNCLALFCEPQSWR